MKEIERLVIDVNTWVKWAANNRVGVWFEAFAKFGIEVYSSSALIIELEDVLNRPFFLEISTGTIEISSMVASINVGKTHIPFDGIHFG